VKKPFLFKKAFWLGKASLASNQGGRGTEREVRTEQSPLL